MKNPSKLPNAGKAGQPDKLKPQLASLVKSPPEGGEWLHEIKYDGYRILAFLRGKKTKLLSRRGKDWTSKFPEIAEILQSFPLKPAVLDGEIVVLQKGGTTDFQALQNVLKGIESGKLVYYLFDILYSSGYSLTRTPLIERKKLLQSALQKMSNKEGAVRYTSHIKGRGNEVYKRACRMGAEGIVSKQSQSSYESKRTRTWVKVKCMNRQEFVIGGFSEPSGARSGFGSLLVGYYQNSRFIYAGRVGTGFNQKTLKELDKKLKKIEKSRPSFHNPPAGREAEGVHWVKPELAAEIEFREWTQEGNLRQPSFKGLREDKSPREITKEEPVKSAGNSSQKNGENKNSRKFSLKNTSNPALISGVKLSHPDKILYPEQGVSKKELAEFYDSIAEYILPHIVKRPLTVVRCPDGRNTECFFQKHWKDVMPEDIRSIPVSEKNKTRRYIMIKNKKGLISLVQMGVLEIHPWGSREDAIEKPDRVVFDLDPGEKVSWKDIMDTARFLRNRLKELGLRSFLKTSGGKGLHLVIPVERRSNWEEIKAFTGAFVKKCVQERPDKLLAKSKDPRKGKIFVDYFRNDRGATNVAAYSSRARKGAPVSTPIRWDELSSEIKPDSYTIENLTKRLRSLKEDPWKGYFTIRQSITQSMKKAVGLKE